MGHQRRRWRGGLPVRLAIGAIAILATSSATLAQETVQIFGDHLKSMSFGTEMSDNQPLALEVIMALNNRAELNRFEADLQNRDSPNYHHWLTPDEFNARFGPTPGQMQAVANWLGSRGLLVTSIDSSTRTVRFSGSYGGIKAALQLKIMTDGVDYANVTDPQVPAELAPTIVSIEGLIRQNPIPAPGLNDSIVSTLTCANPPCRFDTSAPYFGPGDLYTFYDEIPVLNSGNLGTGGANSPADCIALPEGASVNTQALTDFVNQFTGLPSALPSPGVLPPVSLSAVNPPVNGATPTATPGLPGDNEPYLDIEWAHAVSPNTPIRIYYSNNGYLAALQYAVAQNQCGVISSSVEGGCQPITTILALDDVEAQAAAQGQTVFKSSGDWGDNWYCGSPVPTELTQASPAQMPYAQSSCGNVPGSETSTSYADANGDLWQPSIDEEAASPNITVVGGTQFQPLYSAGYNISTVSQGLESAWNNGDPEPSPSATAGYENCPIKNASGGGPSVIFPKPAWQTGVGVPNDGARDIPDVAMGANGTLVGAGAEANLPGFFVATQTIPNSGATPTALIFTLTGGTSIATPMWAGVSRLIAQQQGVTRLGNINPRLYELGNLRSATSGLHDITAGNNTIAGIPGYNAGPGYDLVTGWGSPDIARLVAAFPGAAAVVTPVNTTVVPGQTVAAAKFVINNTLTTALNVTSVTVAFTTPALFSSVSLTATVGSAAPQVASSPVSSSSTFTFSPAVVIPSGGSATMVLEGSAAITAPIVALVRGIDPGGSGGSRLPWKLGGFAMMLAAALLMAPRRRTPYAFSVLALGTLVILVSSCGGGSGGGTSPAPPAVLTTSQSIVQGGIVANDGNGGVVQVSGLPTSLGSVSVTF